MPKLTITPTHECAACGLPIQLLGSLWTDTKASIWCGDGRHAPAVLPPKPRAEWDNGTPVKVQLAAKHQRAMTAIRDRTARAQAARDALGLGVFDPLKGPETLTGCTVSWIDPQGSHEAIGVTAVIYGAAITVVSEGLRFSDRLSSPSLSITR